MVTSGIHVENPPFFPPFVDHFPRETHGCFPHLPPPKSSTDSTTERRAFRMQHHLGHQIYPWDVCGDVSEITVCPMLYGKMIMGHDSYIYIYIYYIISYYIILYYTILYYIILYHIILYYIILYYTILYYIILYYIIYI